MDETSCYQNWIGKFSLEKRQMIIIISLQMCVIFPRKLTLKTERNNNSNEQIHGNGTDNEQFMIIVCSPNVPNGKGLHCYSHWQKQLDMME